ncbi:hypothetical protein HGRIS_002547 [Hohenbuehelia grisea]|uniref:TPR-like protein n=1 Tax=Hohenbuehelia grisea TaxID=104357 RepID=A0ABR3JLQ9_9AGAR
MALPMLVGGSDCGPSNPLQGLSKRFDQDRGLQQDHFGAGRAGSSRITFRSAQTSSQRVDQDAARFFSSERASPQQLASSSAFDLSAMHNSLPQTPMTMQHPAQAQHPIAQQHGPAANWAADFLQMPAAQSSVVMQQEAAVSQQQQVTPGLPQGGAHWNPLMAHRMTVSPPLMMPMQAQQPAIKANHINWDQEFQSQENAIAVTTTQQPAAQEEEAADSQMTQLPPQATDELAQIAGKLLDHVQGEQNPKFQQSQFMTLMKQFRDGEMVVKGNAVVENDGEVQRGDAKGKGRAVEPGLAASSPQASEQPSSYFPMEYSATTVYQERQASIADEVRARLREQDQEQGYQEVVDENDAYFRQENEEYIKYWDNQRSQPVLQHAASTPWDHLQADWDQFEATTAGIRPVENYQFQTNNPYLLGDSSTRHHMLHHEQSIYESVLELEAAVQRDMNNASAWYMLGVKQQENERESKAIQALRRAVDLDPKHLPTWLALAISYTNDSNRQGTHDAVREWVDANTTYASVVQAYRAAHPVPVEGPMTDQFNDLIQCLIAMATSGAGGDVDADVQIALAVLLNTNEDYGKAKDCFTTALAARPDDWLLYNRVGATMANSGHPQEALQYYYRALELNPLYIRARFNLGISCINLRRYDEAAGHILDALSLQENDGVRDGTGMNEKRGVTSAALWESLKTTCLKMQRVDLATLCDHHDLDGFRANFHIHG